MALEQIRDAKRVDARADVWSLGVLLYELYTGRPAFHRDVVIDVFTAVVKGEYVDPAAYGVPRRVRNAIRGALQVDPALRFSDCRALMAASGSDLPCLPAPVVPRRLGGGWPVSVWIRAWSAALVMVVVVFVSGLFVIGGVLSIGGARDDAPRELRPGGR